MGVTTPFQKNGLFCNVPSNDTFSSTATCGPSFTELFISFVAASKILLLDVTSQ